MADFVTNTSSTTGSRSSTSCVDSVTLTPTSRNLRIAITIIREIIIRGKSKLLWKKVSSLKENPYPNPCKVHRLRRLERRERRSIQDGKVFGDLTVVGKNTCDEGKTQTKDDRDCARGVLWSNTNEAAVEDVCVVPRYGLPM